jgi:hypothetical protein
MYSPIEKYEAGNGSDLMWGNFTVLVNKDWGKTPATWIKIVGHWTKTSTRDLPKGRWRTATHSTASFFSGTLNAAIKSV